jgi:hypothetical protein
VASPSAAASVAPTTLPEPTLFGEFPGPDATVPPEQHVITGLRLDNLTGLWASLGLSCFSHPSGGPESAASYNVHCEAADPATNVEVVAGADYWTFQHVRTIDVNVGSITMDGAVDAPSAAREWVLPFAALMGGKPLVAWVEEHIADPTCLDGCKKVIRDSNLTYIIGSRGGQILRLTAPSPA